MLCALLTTALLLRQTLAQTTSNCNPVQGQTCPADPALGRSTSYDLTTGASNDFTSSGSPSYGSNGVSFTVAKSGDAPQLNSKWYMMFGTYSMTMQVAPGVGIVSSIVLQSDDLDEIDWEFLGADPIQGQTNYFREGNTAPTNRAAFLTVPNTQSSFHTYSVEWTSTQITWSVDGTPMRTLTAADAGSQYPQTPMQLKFGAWAGGDPSNPAGTIQWAGGPTNYAAGPFTMVVSKLTATDYSTGTSYAYNGASGAWTSITANGGSVNGNAGAVQQSPSVAASSVAPASSAPVVTTSVAQAPWTGTHKTTSSMTTTYTTYPELPSGWTVSSSGKVVPPSSGAAAGTPRRMVVASAAAMAIGVGMGAVLC